VWGFPLSTSLLFQFSRGSVSLCAALDTCLQFLRHWSAPVALGGALASLGELPRQEAFYATFKSSTISGLGVGRNGWSVAVLSLFPALWMTFWSQFHVAMHLLLQTHSLGVLSCSSSDTCQRLWDLQEGLMPPDINVLPGIPRPAAHAHHGWPSCWSYCSRGIPLGVRLGVPSFHSRWPRLASHHHHLPQPI